MPSGKKPAEAADTIGHLKKPAVLEAYKGCANVSKACGIVGIARDTFYRWLKEDPKFKDDYETAREQAIELLEDEAMRRAHEGIAKPIFHAGKRAVDVVLNPDGSVKLDPVTKKPIGIPAVVREYSDTLLIFLLKGARPQKYRDNVRQEVTGAGGAPLIPTKIVIEVVPTPTAETEFGASESVANHPNRLKPQINLSRRDQTVPPENPPGSEPYQRRNY